MDAENLEMLDVDQFVDLEDALRQLEDSRAYEEVLARALERTRDYTLLTMFGLSACTRFRGLHEAVVRELGHANPHAVFPLNRAFGETVLTVAYVIDNPDYVLHLTERRGDQPKGLKRLPIKSLIDHIEPVAPGFGRVYDELCEITHFGSVALWQPHEAGDGGRFSWQSAPRWKTEREALIAAAQLKELREAATTYLHNFAGRHIITRSE